MPSEEAFASEEYAELRDPKACTGTCRLLEKPRSRPRIIILSSAGDPVENRGSRIPPG